MLNYPLGRRVGRDIEMDDPPSPMVNDEPNIQETKSYSRDDEEVHRGDCVLVIVQERDPALLLATIRGSLWEMA